MGLDTVELTWENEGRKNFEDLVIESNYDLYEVTSVTKRAVRFPKYDNIVMDPRRYPRSLKIVIPLDVLGLQDEKGRNSPQTISLFAFVKNFHSPNSPILIQIWLEMLLWDSRNITQFGT